MQFCFTDMWNLPDPSLLLFESFSGKYPPPLLFSCSVNSLGFRLAALLVWNSRALLPPRFEVLGDVMLRIKPRPFFSSLPWTSKANKDHGTYIRWYSEHVAHARRIKIFSEKNNPICDCSRSLNRSNNRNCFLCAHLFLS